MEVLDFISSGEELISLAEATKLLPKRNGKKTSIRTLERWIRFGHRGVFLEAARTGGFFSTSREALQRFSAKCMQADVKRFALPAAAEPKKPVPRKSRSQEELEKAGWAGRKSKRPSKAK